MKQEEMIRKLNELKKTFSGIENGKENKAKYGDLLINAYDILECALVIGDQEIAEDAFDLIKSIVLKDEKNKIEVIKWLNGLKGKFKELNDIKFINNSIIDLDTDQVNIRNMRIIRREIEKTYGSNYVSDHLHEIIGNVVVAASIDKLTAKVTELIDVLKQR